MNRKQRVIWSDNGTLKDISSDVNDYRRGTYVVDLAVTADYLYIGSELPFNHKHFELGAVNSVSSVLSVQAWNGATWVSMVDVKDETSVSGKTLAQSGMISWSPDIDSFNWYCQRDSNLIPALVGTRIFNLYWARFSVSASVTGTTSIKYIGQKFSDDDDLDDLYPDLANSALKTAFEAGKTDWKAQEFAAAEAIVSDLRAQGLIVRGDQIMDASLLNMASIHKTASIIYFGLGNGFLEKWKVAEDLYRKSLSLKFFEVDKNGDGIVSAQEKTQSVGFGTR